MMSFSPTMMTNRSFDVGASALNCAVICASMSAALAPGAPRVMPRAVRLFGLQRSTTMPKLNASACVQIGKPLQLMVLVVVSALML